MNNPITVLLVDDHEIVRQGVRAFLEARAEFTVVGEAETGTAAVTLVEEHIPDVVLMDLIMPGMTGWEVAKAVKADSRFARTAVIMLTGIGETVNAATAPLYGADDRIDKPIDFAELEFKIRRVLSEKRRQAAAEASGK